MLHSAICVKASEIEGRGLSAIQPIKEGEILWRPSSDARRFHISVIRSWPKEKQVRFIKYSHQINEEWHIGYEEGVGIDPGDYFNHSCDPNAWWADELTLIARRNINEGEEITFDYATSEIRPDFQLLCCCGSPLCRQVITGSDYRLHKFLQERYNKHVMPHVLKTLSNGS